MPGAIVELPLTICTAKPGKERARCFSFYGGSVEDVADGGSCGCLHGGCSCFAPMLPHLVDDSLHDDDVEGAKQAAAGKCAWVKVVHGVGVQVLNEALKSRRALA